MLGIPNFFFRKSSLFLPKNKNLLCFEPGLDDSKFWIRVLIAERENRIMCKIRELHFIS